MANEKREFKGVWFPAEVWLDERLTALEKIILIEIDSLDGEDGCYASNEYLAKFCQCSQSKVSNAISKLKGLGYISVKSFDGRKRILESCLAVSIGQTTKKEKSADQILEERILEKTSTKSPSRNKAKYPSLQEVEEHVRAKGYHFDPKQFFAYYEASGWHFKDGRPVKSWKQCCVTWEGNCKRDTVQPKPKEDPVRKFFIETPDGQKVLVVRQSVMSAYERDGQGMRFGEWARMTGAEYELREAEDGQV